MSCKTSDERREVAERLRQASHTDANLDVTIAIAILDTIGEVHRPIAAVVADLIDPTCHVRGFGHPDEFRVVKGCSACHYGWYEDVFGRPYRYCPHCGARVVSDDE